jgi:regulator of replication initiation timing
MKIPVPPTDPPKDTAPPVTDIGIARRAREAASENEKLKLEIEKLNERHLELRRQHDGMGDLSAEVSVRTHDEYRCNARAPGGGKHPVVRVNGGEDRYVECRVCGARLDPIDVLLQFAHAERMFSYHLTSLRQEVTQLQADRDRLKAERSSLRSQVRRKTARRSAAVPKETASTDRDEATRWAKELADSMTEKSRQ